MAAACASASWAQEPGEQAWHLFCKDALIKLDFPNGHCKETYCALCGSWASLTGNHVWIVDGQLYGCKKHKSYMDNYWDHYSLEKKFEHALDYCKDVPGSAAELRRMAEGMGVQFLEVYEIALKKHKENTCAAGSPKVAGPPSMAGNRRPPPPPPPPGAHGGPVLFRGADLCPAALPVFGTDQPVETAPAMETMPLWVQRVIQQIEALTKKMDALASRVDIALDMLDKKWAGSEEYQ